MTGAHELLALCLLCAAPFGAVELEGTSTKRRVTLKVTVDGAPADALGVMSQGELNALALMWSVIKAWFAGLFRKPT